MPAESELAAPRVGRIVYLHRKRQGLTQRDLGEKVGVDSTYISRIERGLVGTPQRPLLVRLADALGIQVGEFYLSEAERHAYDGDGPRDLLDEFVADIRADAKVMADIRQHGGDTDEDVRRTAVRLMKAAIRAALDVDGV